jgi:rRNA maturation endonuclease Nob1
MVKLMLLTLMMLGIAFAGIAIKLLVKKNGEFSGSCASKNPHLNPEGQACGYCGALPNQQCKSESVA